MPPLYPPEQRSLHSCLRGALLLACLQGGPQAAGQCFPGSPVPGFFEEAVGGEVIGSARVHEGLIEICSVSRGYGLTIDSLLALAQDTSNDFEISAGVAGIEGSGQAGVEARVFRGTGSDPAQAVVRISVEGDPGGIGFIVLSSVRLLKYGAMESLGTGPVEVDLPVRIGIERDGERITTFFFGGEGRVDHLTVQVQPDSPLDSPTYRVGLVHGSDVASQGPAASGIGRFDGPVLERDRSTRPPRLSRAVEGTPAAVDRSAVLSIRGTGLSRAEEVTVAGERAEILEARDDRLVVEVPPTGRPLRGDVVVRAAGGTSEVPGAFFSLGKSFIRCDCNGDGEVDVSDMIRMLDSLFVGGGPCECAEAGDCNDDDERDLSDPIRGLIHLFLNGQPGLPEPFPGPGTDPSAPLCGLEDQVPAVTSISRQQIAEGDVFSIGGSRFSDGTQVVIPGARLEVLGRTPDTITLRAGVIVQGGSAPVHVLEDLGSAQLPPCRRTKCAATWAGPLSTLDSTIELVPSGVPVAGVSHQEKAGGPIVLQLDRGMFDPRRPVEVLANLASPAIAGVSPGGRATSFQMDPAETFESAIVHLAERLWNDLAGGGYLGEADVLPEPELGQIVITPTAEFPGSSLLLGHVAVFLGTTGRCGPQGTHPIEDERAHGWCRLEELVEPCDGLPGFEWYIPLSHVKSKVSSLADVPHPGERSPHEKAILYNLEAYCHVRRHRLWNLCALERLVEIGRDDIPDFPVGAWVTKTIWRTAEELPRGVTRERLYSYVYLGDGKTYYLTAIHHITKDIDRWFWYDIYPAEQVLEGAKGDFVRGVGGCGGTNVDAPPWVAGTIWANYYLCTNVTRNQPLSTGGVGGVGPTPTQNSAWCGNFEFAPECPDEIDALNLVPPSDCFTGDATCLQCHQDGSLASVAGSTLGMDFLHSLKSAAPEPDPCRPGEDSGPVTWVTHVGPFTSNHCHCHSNWMEYDTLVNAVSGPAPPMLRVKPFDPMNSFLWRKVTDTHHGLCATTTACGVPMPKGAYPLTDSELDMLEEWILAGAPYD